MNSIDVVAGAVQDAARRETGGNLRAYAKRVEVPYDALYALATGRRQRAVNVETLIRLSAHIPEVRGLFAPAEVE